MSIYAFIEKKKIIIKKVKMMPANFNLPKCKHRIIQSGTIDNNIKQIMAPSKMNCGHVPAQVIQNSHVCIHIVEVVGVGRVVLLGPVDRQWTV